MDLRKWEKQGLFIGETNKGWKLYSHIFANSVTKSKEKMHTDLATFDRWRSWLASLTQSMPRRTWMWISMTSCWTCWLSTRLQTHYRMWHWSWLLWVRQTQLCHCISLLFFCALFLNVFKFFPVSGDLKLVEKPQPIMLGPNDFSNIKVRVGICIVMLPSLIWVRRGSYRSMHSTWFARTRCQI